MSVDLAERNAFGLGSLGVAAAVLGAAFVVAGVEEVLARDVACAAELALVAGKELLELGARIPHQPAVAVPDAEGARAVAVEVVVHQAVAGGVFGAGGIEHDRVPERVGAVAHGPTDVEAAEDVVVAACVRVAGHRAAVGEGGRVELGAPAQGAQLRRQVVAGTAIETAGVHQVLDAEFLDEALAGIAGPVVVVAFAPGAGIAFIGGHQVGLATHRIRGHCVGQVQAAHAGQAADVDQAVLIGHVHLVAGGAVVLEAQRQDVGDRGAGDVDLRHRVVLLQRGPCGLAVGGNGDVLGLEVLRGAGARAIDAHTLRAQRGLLAVERGEVGDAHGGCGRAAHVHDGDAAFGVGLVVVAGLAFVGQQHGLAIRREGDHVGQRAHGGRAQQRQVAGAVQGHAARGRLHGRLNGHRHQAVVHGHAVDLGAGQHAAGIDLADLHRVGGHAQVQHIHLAGQGVHHEQALGGGVVGGDLGRRDAELAGGVAADLFELDAQGLGRGRGRVRGVTVATASAAGREGGGGDQGGSKTAQGGPAGGACHRISSCK